MTEATALREFLDKLGLDQYLDAMLAEDLTLDSLSDLEEADLRELGLSMGHRKLLRKALSEQSDAMATAAPQTSPEAEATSGRRQVTIFFCDLVGSTELASHYDAEDMSEIYERYHSHATRLIERYGGRSLFTQGDGIVACFGYPRASEYDAEHAAAAALDISRDIPTLHFKDGLVLHTRIGIATGRVYVRGNADESSALVGDTLNLASRLQDSADTDTVVAGRNTKRLIERSAILEFREERMLKGFDDAEEIWHVKSIRDVADRRVSGDGTVSDEAGLLLGRDAELAQMEHLWADTKRGKGQVLVFSGEAGIGKSQLISAARDIIADDDARLIRYFCAPGYENSALYPVRSQIVRSAGLGEVISGDEVAARLADYARTDDPTTVRLLADLLSLDPGEAVPPLNMTAAEQKIATFVALQTQLTAEAAHGPVMILLEDIHWADPTTLELLAAIATQTVPEHPIFMIVTHRPNVSVDWGPQDHVHQVTLNRLSRSESREIIKRVMGDRMPTTQILHTIIEYADGIPLFIEELSRSVSEQLDESGGNFQGVSVPITLEDSLMARLDRLSVGKSVVETAAVFGRRFPTTAVRMVLDMDVVGFEAAIVEPVSSRILLPERTIGSDAMLFRHALVQQAAYEGITRKQRQKLHARIAELLLEHQPGVAEAEPETLAWHYAGAGDYAQAINYLLAAGKKATSRAAQIEAVNHYSEALTHLEELPESRERTETQVLLLALLGAALIATRGFAAPEVYDTFAKARELCLELGDSPMYCSCLYGLFQVQASRSDRDEALSLAGEMLETFADAPVPSWQLAANFCWGVAHLFAGNFDIAEDYIERALALYTPDQHAPLVEQFGDDIGEYALCYRHWLYFMRGELDKSEAYLDRVDAIANALNNRASQTRGNAFRLGRTMEMGAAEDVGRTAPKIIEVATAQGYPYWACVGQIALGWSMATAGQTDGIAPIEGSLQFFDMIGQSNPQTYWRTYLIDAYTHLGQREAALDAAEKAMEMSNAGLDCAFEPTILLRKGQAQMLAPRDAAGAEETLRAAIEAANRIGSHFYTFQAAMVLAELLLDEGRANEEGGLLAQSWARITGASAPMKAQAQALLDRL